MESTVSALEKQKELNEKLEMDLLSMDKQNVQNNPLTLKKVLNEQDWKDFERLRQLQTLNAYCFEVSTRGCEMATRENDEDSDEYSDENFDEDTDDEDERTADPNSACASVGLS